MKNRLKIARAELDITQEELAKRIGVSRQTINAVESGKYVPSTVLALNDFNWRRRLIFDFIYKTSRDAIL